MRLSNGIRWLAVAAFLATSGQLSAQSTASLVGRVTDDNGAGISGVQVVVTNQNSGTQNGALSQSDGRFTVVGLRAGGPYRVEARMIGYGLMAVDDVMLSAGQTRTIDFRLTQEAVALDAIEVFATRAIERKTPVAYSDVPKVQIQNQLGSQDLPMVLNVTPSVYATQQGGGAGDARVNVRGFSQRNTAVMINGVPVNDMENGWVYWSNWDGLGDASTSIQLQRGLSAVNLATPSIGGTLNVITDPTAQRRGAIIKQEFGSGNFLKTTVTASTGEVSGFALTASASRKTADGVIDQLYTDAWSYYLASSYQLDARNRFELYAVGAPQTHGQRLYSMNAAIYSTELAQQLGYSQEAIDDYRSAENTNFNMNVAPVTNYNGQQYASVGPETGQFNRQLDGYLHERENYFHKPQVNLNWYSYLGNGLNLSTVAYYSGGAGGGSGTMGDEEYDFTYSQRILDWNATIADNVAAPGQVSNAIIRSSVNSQWTIGAISKLRKDYEGGLTAEVGLDWRMAEIDHYRDVRDLLGGSSFECSGANGCGQSDFWGAGDEIVGFGDKIDYYNRNNVNWIGGYLQAEKTTPTSSVYGMAGWSQISYDFEDFFAADPTSPSETLKINSGNLTGYQIKGGGVYNANDEVSLFANAGWVSKVPIFDGVIDDRSGVKNPDPKNETFLSFEGGVRFRGLGRGISADLSFYHTTWKDRTRNQFVRNINGSGDDGLVNLLGLDARHYGVEGTIAYQPNDLIRFDGALSVGNWTYLNDVGGTYDPDGTGNASEAYNFYLDGLKVGDAPQTQFAYAASLFPVDGMNLRVQGKTYARHYADFNPFSRTDMNDRTQSWQIPSYTLVDIHASYRLGDVLPSAGDVRLFANVLNVLDELYVSDADDNGFGAFDDDHDADDAAVYIGLPRTLNMGIQISF
jgi:hypothetical protein